MNFPSASPPGACPLTFPCIAVTSSLWGESPVLAQWEPLKTPSGRVLCGTDFCFGGSRGF